MAHVKIDALAFPAETKKYIANVLDPILVEMMQELVDKSPKDPVKFVCEWLRNRGRLRTAERMTLEEENAYLKKELSSCTTTVGEMTEGGGGGAKKHHSNPNDEESEEESEPDEAELAEAEKQALKAKAMQQGPRQSVSAEAYGAFNTAMAKSDAPVFEKSDEQKASIRKILKKSFLFNALSEPDMNIIVGAMEEKTFEPGARIITQGEDGDVARHLYIIEEGTPECKKLINGQMKVVKKCVADDVFGELALLYNCPRAATVETQERCLCWRLDRETFNSVVREAAMKRTEEYDKFLKEVPLFAGLGQSDRVQIIDALKNEQFKKGDEVLKQHDSVDHRFYIVESGTVAAMKKVGDQDPTNVAEYTKGMYFGELALMKHQPRAATIVVTSETASVFSVDRRCFMNLVDSVSDILEKRIATYK